MRTVIRLSVLAVVAVMLAACSGTVATRGHLVEDRRMSQIEPGLSTANDVLAVLGSPSTVAPFDERIWYYIGQRTEQVAFLRPDVIERRVVRIRFDEGGTVREIDELDMEDSREVELVDRETPTMGRQMGFMEQMVGNLGRFNQPGDE